MDLSRRRFLQLTAAAVAPPAVFSQARAEIYPARQVRIVVGFPAGGPVDIAARVISPWLTERLGQPFLIENRPGASGNVATREVVKADPDGYTLLLCGPVNAINTTLFDKLDFNFTKDTAPIAGISSVPLVVEVHPAVAARTLPEFIAYAKASPGTVKVAYAGKGTPQHIGIELFKMMADVDLTLVPYLGSAPALADLLAGRVDAMFDPMPSSIEHIRAGRLVPLAVTSAQRSDALPQVPAASEFMPGYEAGSWFGLVAPRNTPDEILRILNREINAGLADANVQARLRGMGGSAMPGSSDDFGRFIAAETAKYERVIRSAKIRVE